MTEQAHAIEPLIDAHQAADIVGMSVDWIFQEAAAGRLPSYKLGRARNAPRKFRPSELEAFLQTFSQGPEQAKIASVTSIDGRRR